MTNNNKCPLLLLTPNIGSSVEERINNLEKRFNQHLRQLQMELNNKDISVQMLRNSLTELPTSQKFENDRAITERLPKLRKAKSVEEFFLLLGLLVHFIDYHLVKHYISTFGSESLMADIFSYEQEVKTFMKETKVGEVMRYWPGQNSSSRDFKKLWVKIRDDPETYTLKELNELRNKHCAKLKFSAILSAIVDITPADSFYAVWSVPTMAVDDVRRGIQRLGRVFYEPEHIDMIILGDKLVYLSNQTEKVRLYVFTVQFPKIWHKKLITVALRPIFRDRISKFQPRGPKCQQEYIIEREGECRTCSTSLRKVM